MLRLFLLHPPSRLPVPFTVSAPLPNLPCTICTPLSISQLGAPVLLVRKRNAQSPVPFKYLCWLAYKCDLDSDLIFLDDKNDGEENDDAEDVRAARCGGGGKER